MPQRYNMPFGRQKPLCYFFLIFLQDVKHDNIIDNFLIYDRNEIAEDEINFLMCTVIAFSRYLRFSLLREKTIQ
jgi:hypothetical protein